MKEKRKEERKKERRGGKKEIEGKKERKKKFHSRARTRDLPLYSQLPTATAEEVGHASLIVTTCLVIMAKLNFEAQSLHQFAPDCTIQFWENIWTKEAFEGSPALLTTT